MARLRTAHEFPRTTKEDRKFEQVFDRSVGRKCFLEAVRIGRWERRVARRRVASSQNYLATSEGSLGIDVEELILTLSRSSLRPSLFGTATEYAVIYVLAEVVNRRAKTVFISFI